MIIAIGLFCGLELLLIIGAFMYSINFADIYFGINTDDPKILLVALPIIVVTIIVSLSLPGFTFGAIKSKNELKANPKYYHKERINNLSNIILLISSIVFFGGLITILVSLILHKFENWYILVWLGVCFVASIINYFITNIVNNYVKEYKNDMAEKAKAARDIDILNGNFTQEAKEYIAINIASLWKAYCAIYDNGYQKFFNLNIIQKVIRTIGIYSLKTILDVICKITYLETHYTDDTKNYLAEKRILKSVLSYKEIIDSISNSTTTISTQELLDFIKAIENNNAIQENRDAEIEIRPGHKGLLLDIRDFNTSTGSIYYDEIRDLVSTKNAVDSILKLPKPASKNNKIISKHDTPDESLDW